MTDEQLSRLATRGDRDAFMELFSRHEHGLLNFCHRMTGSREDAADLVQESFLRVFARLESLEGREVNLAAYLRRTARNLVYDRSAQRGGEVVVEDVALLAGPDEALETDPERAALLADQQAAVRRANAALPERHRLALALRELEDMDYAQIGEVLEVTPDAVAQLLVRARLGLRRALRIASVDEERMAPACRSRLADIGALIDGQLGEDRAFVLGQHLATCAVCAQARSAFQDARIRYRAWLPVPVILGLGAQTLRAAEGRGLLRSLTDGVSWGQDEGPTDVRPADAARPGGGMTAPGARTPGAADAATPWSGWSRRRRVGAVVGGGALLLFAGGGSAVFALRGEDPAPAAQLPATTLSTATAAGSAPPPAAPAGTTTQATSTAAAPAGTTSAAAPGRRTTTAVPATTAAAITQAAPRAARTPRRATGTTSGSPRTPQAPAAPGAPQVTIATPVVTDAPPAPATTASPPAAAAPTITQRPPVTTQRPPVVTVAPPVVTTVAPPTIRVPVAPPVTTVRVPTIAVPSTTIRVPTIRIPIGTTTTTAVPR